MCCIPEASYVTMLAPARRNFCLGTTFHSCQNTFFQEELEVLYHYNAFVARLRVGDFFQEELEWLYHSRRNLNGCIIIMLLLLGWGLAIFMLSLLSRSVVAIATCITHTTRDVNVLGWYWLHCGWQTLLDVLAWDIGCTVGDRCQPETSNNVCHPQCSRQILTEAENRKWAESGK